MANKKIIFSNIVSKVKLKNDILKIDQLRFFALICIVLFLGVLTWLGFNRANEFPLIIKLSMSLGGLILLYALYDISTSKVSFTYYIGSDLLQIKAKRRGFKLNYNGPGKSALSLITQKQMRGKSNRERFGVVLKYNDNECSIPFLLSGGHTSPEKAQLDLLRWEKKLNLEKSTFDRKDKL
ncbi:MAG: hypothetical protein CME65_12585 [Halobacteriovoraceae bacterium]|nr:hypothetical protein [Halobacteriovoraceae bacterium]|tara:strand:+ start:2021 stop:2563 length:543 start_codon:yes stop_codon:yes gene_type:complete